MRLGDAPDGPQVPRPRNGSVSPVPITARSGGIALLDEPAPPWLRMPEVPPAVRLAAVPAPAPAPRAVPEQPVRPVTDLAARRAPLSAARPRVVEEPSILGLSRRTRSRLGSRLFSLFFVAVFALIAVQMVLAILYG